MNLILFYNIYLGIHDFQFFRVYVRIISLYALIMLNGRQHHDFQENKKFMTTYIPSVKKKIAFAIVSNLGYTKLHV